MLNLIETAQSTLDGDWAFTLTFGISGDREEGEGGEGRPNLAVDFIYIRT